MFKIKLFIVIYQIICKNITIKKKTKLSLPVTRMIDHCYNTMRIMVVKAEAVFFLNTLIGSNTAEEEQRPKNYNF